MKITQTMIDKADEYWQRHAVRGGIGKEGWTIAMGKGFSLEDLLRAALGDEGCGCMCEPEGTDGLRCPREDGTLLCQEPKWAG